MTKHSTHADFSSQPSSMWRHRGFVVAVDRPRPSFKLNWKSIERAMPVAAYVAFFVGASALFLTSAMPIL
ncbi:MAG: hypothetical protein MI741_09160 [Rhodospirillales bacterium]|nr:hypothetical protein [Rhodospirillales bacterium]